MVRNKPKDKLIKFLAKLGIKAAIQHEQQMVIFRSTFTFIDLNDFRNKKDKKQ